MLEVLEIGHGVDVPDGRYTKGQVHATGGKYGELLQFLPRHDPRYIAVLVKDGLVTAIEMADQEGSKPAKVPAPPVMVAQPEQPEQAAPAKPKIFLGLGTKKAAA